MSGTPPTFWTGKRVLVTGANGFVGGWLTKALLGQSAMVVTLVRDDVAGSLRLHGLTDAVVSVAGDVTDAALMARILNEYEVDTVFHLAAQSLVSVANRHPSSTFESNVRGTWVLLEQCRQVPSVSRIVVSTSDKVYGSQAGPATENVPLLGEFPYDASKVCADVIARCYGSTFCLPVAVVRCANIYGGGDLNYSRIIPYTVRNALLGETVSLRSDGLSRREFLYIDDALRAFFTVAEVADRPGVRGQAFNCGSGETIDISSLVQRILDVVDRRSIGVVPLAHEPLHEISAQSLLSSKAATVLGWRASISLDQGLLSTIEWYRSHLGSSR